VVNTNKPTWNQTFVYNNISPAELRTGNRVLEVTIWDYDRFGSNEFLGEVLLDLANIAVKRDDSEGLWHTLNLHQNAGGQLTTVPPICHTPGLMRSGVQSGMYLENDPNMGYAPQTAHPGGLHTHFSPPASLARVSPQDSDPWSDPIYHAGQPYSNRRSGQLPANQHGGSHSTMYPRGNSRSATATPTGSPKRRLPQIPGQVLPGVLLKSPGVDYSEEGGLKVGYQVGYNLLWEACPNRPIIPPMMGVLIMGKCTNKIEAKVYIPPQEVVVWVTTVDTVILK